ncbi:MAG: acyl carrier protein, partial [Rubripirellula sp.]
IFLLHIVTVQFRTVPPAEWVTFGDITAKLVGVTFATKQLQLRTADDILCELRPLIVDVLGVDGEKVVPDARFVEELGGG